MNFRRCLLVVWCNAIAISISTASEASWIKDQPDAGDFVLVAKAGAAPLSFVNAEEKGLARVVADVAGDIARVSGQRPAIVADARPTGERVVLIGTVGRNPWIEELAAAGRLNLAPIRGQWETFLIATVESPWPGTRQALAIVGSDRRGTAFGAYELSQEIGVSPWQWWADVPPRTREGIAVAAGTYKFGPPSVRYRGIFLNDEDWGLQPWAAMTHEQDKGDIGPRTYGRVFELLLRLKANTLWPAMHPSTAAFNTFPENPRLADEYGIVMGSSHAEPMLRNNVREWKAPAEQYNFLTNRVGVVSYWEDRVRANAQFEAIYTIGMRGIHDSNMQGPKTDAERIATLERVFTDQRTLLARYVNASPDAVPQMFCAYKEVLDLYRQGLKVPSAATVVWPDDNFGYVRNFADHGDAPRAGGYGVYYHISYLGRPLAYLWLNTVPPALIWEEMVKAYEHGDDRIWIVNVGDLKPAEIGTEFFLRLAWDVRTWEENAQPRYLHAWAAREFGAEHAEAIAAILMDYYRLNFQRKPEHLQWWLEGERFRQSPFTPEEAAARLQAFADLVARVAKVRQQLAPNASDAFFELVEYPVAGSASANQRYFHTEWYAREFDHHLTEARRHAAAARAADDRLNKLNAHFDEIAGGKWRHFMNLEPADNQWRDMRIAPLTLPGAALAQDAQPADRIERLEPPANSGTVIVLNAGDAAVNHAHGGAQWVTVAGLGRSGKAVTPRPSTAPTRAQPISVETSPYLEYQTTLPAAGRYRLEVQLLPTHPLTSRRPLRVAIGVNDKPFEIIAREVSDGSADWARGVLDGMLRASTTIDVAEAGSVRIKLAMVDAGVVVDRLIISRGAVEPSYFGPALPDGVQSIDAGVP